MRNVSASTIPARRHRPQASRACASKWRKSGDLFMVTGCIYVDDAGNPGAESGSDFLSSSRKSWTAVIVPSSVADAVEVGMGMFLRGVRGEFGASELHFTDIYSGRGVWEDVAIIKRIEIFDLMKDILESFSLPIVHQTASEETLHDHERVFSRLVKAPNSRWDIKNVSHFGFLLLCSNLSRYIAELHKQGPKDFVLPIPLIGIFQASCRLNGCGQAAFFGFSG